MFRFFLNMLTVEVILLIYFGYVSMYSFILSCFALFFRPAGSSSDDKFNGFAILIPSYKEDQVILSVAKDALQQNYPSDYYDVVVIADSLQHATVEKLRALPIRVVEVAFDKSTKVKSLNAPTT